MAAELAQDGDRPQRPESFVDFLQLLEMMITGTGTPAEVARLERRAAERAGELDGVPENFIE